MLKMVCIYRIEQYYRKLEEEYLPSVGLQISIIMDRNCVLNSLERPQPVKRFCG